jgi:antirestriction protein
MTAGSENLYDKDIISDMDIENRLAWLVFLDDTSDMTDDDREFWTVEIEELAELKALVEAVGTEHGGLISESYWETYATNEADDLFGLEKSGAYKWFDYDSYADDLQTDYSQVEFHGTTYYCQG